MNLLARREHSDSELVRKLRVKEFAETDIRLALNQLAEEGLQSNSRFMENYIHYRSNKGYGPLRIRGELLERGIAEDLIEHHLNITDNAWLINVRKVWQKRFKSQLPHDFKARAQQMRFLHYRGFTHEQIDSIFSEE
jgi:regulatory protein